jgi:hypothetical protein
MSEQQREPLPHAQPVRRQARSLNVKEEPHTVYRYAHEVIPNRIA